MNVNITQGYVKIDCKIPIHMDFREFTARKFNDTIFKSIFMNVASFGDGFI